MIVNIQNLRMLYRRRQDTLTVVDIPAWSIAAGDQLAIFGPSGSGKSTLLHILSGIIVPTSGTVQVGNFALNALPEPQRDRFRAQYVGYVFQNLNLLAAYTALENVLMGATFAPLTQHKKALRETAEGLLHLVGLADRMQQVPGELSFGEQQRVAIARALIKRPALILADEPTGALDPRNTTQIIRLLRSACTACGSTLVVVTHEREVLAGFEHQIAYADLNQAWREVSVEPVEQEAVA